jgi:hypothetical protein
MVHRARNFVHFRNAYLIGEIQRVLAAIRPGVGQPQLTVRRIVDEGRAIKYGKKLDVRVTSANCAVRLIYLVRAGRWLTRITDLTPDFRLISSDRGGSRGPGTESIAGQSRSSWSEGACCCCHRCCHAMWVSKITQRSLSTPDWEAYAADTGLPIR